MVRTTMDGTKTDETTLEICVSFPKLKPILIYKSYFRVREFSMVTVRWFVKVGSIIMVRTNKYGTTSYGTNESSSANGKLMYIIFHSRTSKTPPLEPNDSRASLGFDVLRFSTRKWTRLLATYVTPGNHFTSSSPITVTNFLHSKPVFRR